MCIVTRSNGNLMPFSVFKILFPKSTKAELHATKNNSFMLKPVKSDIETI